VCVDRVALLVETGVGRQRFGDGEHADLCGLRLFDGGDLLVAIEGVKSGDGQAVNDDGEEDEEIYNGNHGSDEVLFFRGGGFTGLGEQVPGVLDVEDGSNTC
jgi:hypothetical protein